MATPHHSTLIQASELMGLLDNRSEVVVIDTSFDLADTQAGERGHAASHLPGAFYAHLERDLSGTPTGRNGRHPLPERAVFAASVGRWGVRPGVQVVVYDGHGGMYAARLWWMLRWLGHGEVAVLDGGVAAWKAAGGVMNGVMSAAPVVPTHAAPYPDCTGLTLAISADELLPRLGKSPLIDARMAERFRGDAEPLDAQAGHIPGARNRFFKDNLNASGRFKSAAQLKEEFSALLGLNAPNQVVHQCGSGVTACHNLLAMEMAGFSGSALYAGSWSEWSADPSRPIARG